MVMVTASQAERTVIGEAQHAAGVSSPAVLAQAPVLARCAAGMRGAVGVAGCAAAALAPSGSDWWWVAALANGLWTAIFVRTALRRGLTAALVTAEVALTASLCLAQRWILPAGALPDGVSWIAVILTSSMVVVNFVHPPRRAVPVCAGLMLSHLIGARWAGAADGGVGSAAIHTLQIVSLALLMSLVRRAARLADDVLTALSVERQVSAAAVARRREEAVRSDELHNTVLATLTVVATGGITSSTLRLREQSAVAADVLASLWLRPPEAVAGEAVAGEAVAGDAVAGDAVQVRLDVRLRSIAEAASVHVDVDLTPASALADVVEAVASAVEESLVNVVRHAGATRATLRLRAAPPGELGEPGEPGEKGADGPAHGWEYGRGLVVEVGDDGVGFDPAGVPPHRYGLQHAVLGAMRRVGGSARVESSIGCGARVVLRWPA
jgi:hypothetical protein